MSSLFLHASVHFSMVGLHMMGHQHAESCDALMMKQFQTLVKINIVSFD